MRSRSTARRKAGHYTLKPATRERLLRQGREGQLPTPARLRGECPWCATEQARILSGKIRGGGRVAILECCRGPAPAGTDAPFTPAEGWRAIETARWMIERWRAKPRKRE